MISSLACCEPTEMEAAFDDDDDDDDADDDDEEEEEEEDVGNKGEEKAALEVDGSADDA